MFTDRLKASVSSVVYQFCHIMSLHVCSGENFVLDSRLDYFWEGSCPLGFLLVVS